MKPTPRTESEWRAKFSINPDGVIVSKVLNLPDVTLVTEFDGSNNRIISVEIITPNFPLFDAIDYLQRIANRCTDILSFISGYGVSCVLRQMNEINGEDGTAKTGIVPISFDAALAKPEEVDLTKPAFLRVIEEKDEKLARQLSHFRLGISSSNIIEQIREYYQIIEDEYGQDDPRLVKYKWVRDLLMHAKLDHKKAIAEALKIVGKPYFDPSAPKDISALSTHLIDIKTKARHIIRSKV